LRRRVIYNRFLADLGAESKFHALIIFENTYSSDIRLNGAICDKPVSGGWELRSAGSYEWKQ
jgi:hypothetical protein